MMMKKRHSTHGGSGTLPSVGLPLAIRSCAVALAAAALWLAFGAAPFTAKKKGPPTSKTVVGQVFDGQDNGIAGAAVEITDLSTNKTSAIYTGPEGRFTFTELKLTQDIRFRAITRGNFLRLGRVVSGTLDTDWLR